MTYGIENIVLAVDVDKAHCVAEKVGLMG